MIADKVMAQLAEVLTNETPIAPTQYKPEDQDCTIFLFEDGSAIYHDKLTLSPTDPLLWIDGERDPDLFQLVLEKSRATQQPQIEALLRQANILADTINTFTERPTALLALHEEIIARVEEMGLTEDEIATHLRAVNW